MTNVLIIGATSAIAREAGRIFAERNARFVVVGRNQERLEMMAKDLEVRGAASVDQRTFDADDIEHHQAMVRSAFDVLGPVDLVLVAHGTLPDQQRCETDVDYALAHFHTNATATFSLLLHLANELERQGRGTLAVITSVAGDRARRSNYCYGASKKLTSAMLDGLRLRLAPAGVTVLDVKPGFVDTPMTAGIDKKGPLWAQPATVAARMVAAVDGGHSHVYAPAFWRPIMLVVRALPRAVLQRLPL